MEQKGTTDLQVNHFSYTWTLNKFNLCYEDMYNAFKSPTFSAGTNANLKWCLLIKRQHVYREEHLIVYLQLLSSDTAVNAKLKCSILNHKGEKTLTEELETRYIQTNYENKMWDRLANDVLVNKKQLFPNDRLTIYYEITVIVKVVYTSSNTIQFKVPTCRLSEDLGMLFETEKFSDITLSVDGKEFHVHKNILSARSPVFAAMFEHDFKECKHNRVDITDVHSEVLCEILRFIYTGNVNNLYAMAGDILAAADKYALDRLKVMCAEALHTTLSIENSMEILTLADRHSDEQLKAQSIDFITNHVQDVMDTVGWKEMIKTQSHLISEIFSGFAKQ